MNITGAEYWINLRMFLETIHVNTESRGELGPGYIVPDCMVPMEQDHFRLDNLFLDFSQGQTNNYCFSAPPTHVLLVTGITSIY